MEKSVTTGMQPEDFSGHCPTCSVECQEDILKLVSKFCRGIVVELTGASLPTSRAWEANQIRETYQGGWPTFIVSGGANANSFLEVASKREVTQGDIRWGFVNLSGYSGGLYGYKSLHEDDHPPLMGNCPKYGPRGPYPVRFPSNSGLNWTKRNTDHIDSLSNSNSSADVGVDEIIEGVPDFAVNSVTTVIETIDLYSTEEHFAIFPVCGKLRVEDSGTSYIPIKACLSETVLDTDGNPIERGGYCRTTYDTEALHILVSSDCPDPHIAKTSEHPHLVGRGDEPETVDTYPNKRENPAHSDKREFDNVEQKMHLGMCRTSYAVKVGSVFKTTISGALDGDHVYYTSIHPVAGDRAVAVEHDLNPTDAEIAANDLCPGLNNEFARRASLLHLPTKRYSIDSYEPNWLDYCTPEWTDDRRMDYRSKAEELGCWVACPHFATSEDSRGYYYCGYKLNDLADHTIGQKKFIFASKQDAIDSLGAQLSRQKINSSSLSIAMSDSPVGCFQSRLLTFADPDSFSYGITLSSGGGVPIREMENEAFSISGSMLYNRDQTKQYDLKGGIWNLDDSRSSAADPVVGVTLYEAELSYRTFSDKVELKTDHDLVWSNIYERSLGFGSTTVPDGYATGGYSNKSNLDTPEKALKAWSRATPIGESIHTIGSRANIEMAGFFYRWTQDKYYYDVVQQACDFSVGACTGAASLGPPADCPDFVEGRPETNSRPQSQMTGRVCQAGILTISERPLRRSSPAPFPPLFDEDQRVHGDGTIDFDDFSYATKTVKNVYTEDPNNPDVFTPINESICAPNCRWWGYDFHNGQYGRWERNGTYEDQEQFVSGAECLTTETLPDPDYDYYIHRPKIKAIPNPNHPDAGIFDWSACGEEYSGYGDTWPCTTCWAIDRHDTQDGDIYGNRWSYRAATGCLKCMSSRYIPSGNVMMPGQEACSQKFCQSGYVATGEPHSPLNAGYIWYTNLMEGKALTGFYAGTTGSFALTNCCDVFCNKCDGYYCREEFPSDGKCKSALEGCGCIDEGPSTVTDAAMGCRIIKILKPTASTASSVYLGPLSIKVSLK